MDIEKSKGFTLIELIVTIVVLSIIAGLGLTFFSNLVSTYHSVKQSPKNYQEASYTIERISRELKTASVITSINPLTFQVPMGTPADPTGTTITYQWTSPRLTRNNILIGDDITNFAVTALAGTPPQPDCYHVSIEEGTVTYGTTVCPKNFPSANSGYNRNYHEIF